MSFLNCPQAPTTEQMIKNASEILKNDSEDAMLEYLSECMSHDFKCPDKCDAKAMEFFEMYQDEIEGL